MITTKSTRKAIDGGLIQYEQTDPVAYHYGCLAENATAVSRLLAFATEVAIQGTVAIIDTFVIWAPLAHFTDTLWDEGSQQPWKQRGPPKNSILGGSIGGTKVLQDTGYSRYDIAHAVRFFRNIPMRESSELFAREGGTRYLPSTTYETTRRSSS